MVPDHTLIWKCVAERISNTLYWVFSRNSERRRLEMKCGAGASVT
jgi:hypothetical protein